MSFSVRSGDADITDHPGVEIESGAHYGAISTSKLREYEDVTLTVTYITADGSENTVTCRLVYG